MSKADLIETSAVPHPAFKDQTSGLYTNGRLEFRTALAEGVRATDMGVHICGALVILGASHTGSTDHFFTALRDNNRLVQEPRDSMSFVPFHVNINWDRDVRDFLQQVQTSMPLEQPHHLYHISHIPGGGLVHSGPARSGAFFVECSIDETHVRLTFIFDPAVLEEGIINLAWRQFNHILSGINELNSDRGKLAADFRVASVQDLRRIWSWNATVPTTVELCIHELFYKMVQKQPAAPAVSAHDGELTYEQLDQRSTSVAHQLGKYNVQDSIVPIHVGKSMWTPVAQLAVMKAGGASVVLDISQPKERIKTILHQVSPKVILASLSSLEATHEVANSPVLEVEKAAADSDELRGTNTELPLVSPESRLYVVFTSGSTGLPKGAIITHSNFASAIYHQQASMEFAIGQRVFDFASYAFDVAWSNFLQTITVGGCLCIPSDEERKQDIPAALRKYGVEYAHLTPSVAWFSPDELPKSIKFLQFSGEQLSATLVTAFNPHATIINTYGPAECSVTSTLQLIGSSINDATPPIGSGVGSCTWVVSLDGTQLVPIGAVGELWIEGPLVGQGYLNDPLKTDQAFISSPEWLRQTRVVVDGARCNGRFYRTGDLVRYNGRGSSMTFVGRKDSQVKIRGQRVELGEIEHHLRRSLPDELQQALTIVADVINPPGQSNLALVALVIANNGSDVLPIVQKAAAIWDARLPDAIPAYMVPSAYIPFEAFPLTPTGKVDRRRLKAMAAVQFWDHAGSEGSAPPSERESRILGVWSEVLNIPASKISTTALFTRLGGDSITAMQVVSRCRSQGLLLTVADILRLRTVKALAMRCHDVGAGPASASQAAGDDLDGQPWLLSPMQRQFFDSHPQGLNHYTQSFLLRVTHRIALDALRKALITVVQRHPMLRARFRRREGDLGWEQRVVPGTQNSFVMAAHLAISPDIVHSRQASFDLQQGPVFAADVFGAEGEDEDQTILFSAHHIVIDLVSWRVIWHDLSQCLESTGASLGPPPPSFQRWSHLQFEEAQTLDASLVLPYAVAPGDWSHWGILPGDNRFADSDAIESLVDAESTKLLLGDGNLALRTEPLDILVGALLHSFRGVFSDRPVPPVFLEGHGREPLATNDIDVSETVGWFTTLHPLLVQASASDSVLDVIRHVKDTRARVPAKGRSYIASRYHTTSGREAFACHQNVELLLNYRGVFQQLENSKALLQRENRPDRVVDIPEFGDDYQRMALIEINIVVEGGCARISTSIHRRMHHRKRLMSWLQISLPETISAATRQLLAAPASLTLADLPLLSISYEGLDALLAQENLAVKQVRDIYPCTPMQEGILLTADRGIASYRNSWVWRCLFSSTASSVSPERLATAWRVVTRQHSVFATIFSPHPETGRYLQVLIRDIVPHCVLVLPDDFQSSTDCLLDLDATPLVGSSDPEYTITICHDSNGEVACRLDMSHALIDASSIPVLLRHLADAYNYPPEQELPEYPPFSNVVQYIKGSSHQSATHRAYWKAYLSGVPPCHVSGDLSARSRSQSRESQRYGLVSVPLMANTGIAEYCRQHNITRAVFLEVAWALVLAQLTGMQEVCFGYVCSGRDAAIEDLEDIVGPMISMLVARIRLQASNIDHLLKEVGDRSIEHLAHQHTSLAEVQHALGSSVALFNTAITVREEHRYGSENGLRFEEVREEDPHEYDLVLNAILGGERTHVNIQYRGDHISSGLGKTIACALDTAIRYLISGEEVSQSVYHSYSRHVHGMEESEVLAHWRARFEGLDASPFPTLPSSASIPKWDTESKHSTVIPFWPAGHTRTSLLQASWAVIQAAHANSDDVFFGTTSQALGSAPVLPLRVKLTKDATVDDLLSHLQAEDASEATLNPLRVRQVSEYAARASQYQMVLAITHDGMSEWDNLLAGGISPIQPVALAVECDVKGLEIGMIARFDSGILGASLVRRLLLQMEAALKWLVEPVHLRRSVADIETTSDADMATIWDWNSKVSAPADSLVHDIFACVAEAQPDAPAIFSWDGELTYAQLDGLSTRLALHLVYSLGIGPGSIVPIYIDKSLWTPVAQLAVMKTGAASVLLDVTQPIDRPRAIVNQVNPSVLLTSGTNEAAASLLGVPDLVVLSADSDFSPSASGRTLPRQSMLSDLLYVVFTSGSTGVPKGAMISHANFASAIRYQQQALGYRPGLRVFDFVSYSFDVSWSNVLHTLTSGSCLCIPSEEQRRNDLAGSLRATRSNFVDLTPSILQLLKPEEVPDIQRVLLSGESFTKATLSEWADHPDVLNTYGPAECSVKATMAPVGQTTLDNDIGSGKGLITWVVSLQDPEKLAPFGAVGELWLEGPLVGLGYLGDLEKTAAAFVESPSWLLRGHGHLPGRSGRLYRTGDIVRYETEEHRQCLRFMGRKDTQVKIRGQRVELGEIEFQVWNALVQERVDSAVRVVVEILQPREATNSILVAFVDVGEKRTSFAQGVGARLATKLPGYMIPAAYFGVDCIPIGPTGKTDRRLLRQMGESRTLEQLTGRESLGNNHFRGPQTPIEAQLLKAWATVLQTDAARLGRHDNFFRVGGDSISAMRLVAVAREQGIALSVREIFKHPTLAELAQEVKKVDLRKSSVEPFSLLGSGVPIEAVRREAAKACGVDTSLVHDVLPTTPLQEGLLTLTMRRPGDYILRNARPLTEGTDLLRFRQAWQQVVLANPILRTRIVSLPGHGFVQVIVEGGVLWNPASDSADHTLSSLAEAPIEMGQPLARFALVEKDAKDGRPHWVWSLHHSLFDGWSLGLIEDALQKAYLGDPATKALPIQEFLWYQQQYVNKEAAETFWRMQLNAAEPDRVFTLPYAGYLPQSDHILKVEMDGLDWRGDYTASTVIRAAWAILMASYSGHSDAVFGVTVSGRQSSMPEIERVVAPTIATVPVRVAIDWGITVATLLHQIQAQALDMVPFEQIGLQRIRQLDSHCEQACQFQTFLLVQPEMRKTPEARHGVFDESEAGSSTAYKDYAAFNTYPLMLECQPSAQGLSILVSVDSHVVGLNAARRMGEQLETIVRQLLSDRAKHTSLGCIQQTCSRDLQDVWQWNPPIASINACVHDLLTRVAHQQPGAPAICAWDGDWSYHELDALSTQLACSVLRESGATTLEGSVVPLYFEKSRWMPVAQLGVMKAGGASVALDTNLPPERLRAIVAQVVPKLLLSSQRNREEAMKLSDSVSVVEDTLLTASTSGEQVPDLPSVDPSSLLYVVFTSGSTGTPKGAMVSHANFASAIHYQQQPLELNKNSRVWDFVSYAFDVSWSNVLQTLCSGGCLCIPSDAARRDNPGASIQEMHVNYAHLTPTVARLLTGLDLPSLETVSFIGEPLRNSDVAYWQDKVRVINTYGPAECTPVATIQLVAHNGSYGHSTDPSVGRGIGVGTWVVDIHTGKLAAVGAVGELWLEGPLVGLGYLRSPEKTAEVFVEDPAWLLEGGRRGRLYRTGDMVRYQADGALFFVGRKDSQVKIRGQRVELGEIEHHVRAVFSKSLRLSHVVAELVQPADSHEPLLVVFVELAASEHKTVGNGLEEASYDLLQSVPSHMIPTAYVALSPLPMTASGKTDRIALRRMGSGMKRHELLATSATPTRLSPSTDKEFRLLGLVARQIGVPSETISMTDSFIRAGGDSISAVQLASLAREQGLQIPVEAILTAPTLTDVANQITDSAAFSSITTTPFAGLDDAFIHTELLPRVEIAQASHLSDGWPVTSTQKAYIEDALRSPRRSYYQFFVDFLPSVDRVQLLRSCEALLCRHDIFRSVFVSVDGRYYQALFEELPLPIHYEVVEATSINESFEHDRMSELQTPAALGTPWVRAKILAKPNVGVRLVLSISHALYDGITLGILARDLASLYQGIPLPEPASFAGYMSHIASSTARSHEYWTNLLHGSASRVVAYDRPEDDLSDDVPTELDRTVELLIRKSGVTPATIFTTACAMALSKTATSPDFVFGRVVSTRAALGPGINDVVGPCINTLPVKVSAVVASNAAAPAATKADIELLIRTIQQQYIDGIHYEAASPESDYGGFPFTFSSTSAWCTTQFQNLVDRPELPGMPVAPGSVLDARSDVDLPVCPAFLWIYGTPQPKMEGGGVLKVNLKITAGAAFSGARIQQLLDNLYSACEKVASVLSEA